jgi:hypothetical protein
MSTTDELLRNAERSANEFTRGELPLPPAQKGLAYVPTAERREVG